MLPHRVETTFTEDGRLVLDHLPFRSGEVVEVMILPRTIAPKPDASRSLRGMVLEYRDPTAPVDDDSWDAGK